MSQWIDYRELKREISFTDVLEYYEIEYSVKGDQAKAKCKFPNHEGDEKSKSLSVSLDRNVFQCFGCNAKGNVLDFICLMEGLNPTDPPQFHKAAVLAKQKFLYTPQRDPGSSAPGTRVSAHSERSSHGRQGSNDVREIVNPPLDFELQGLDREHPWFAENGFDQRTLRHFGAGYCKRGYFKGRIAIPLYNVDGQLVGYVGCALSPDRNATEPQYLFPKTREREGIRYVFDTNKLLYWSPTQKLLVKTLLLTCDPLTTWRVWQAGCKDVVGALTPSLSDVHVQQLMQMVSSSGAVCVCAPNTPHGEKFASDVFLRVGQRRDCRLILYQDIEDLLSILCLDLDHEDE